MLLAATDENHRVHMTFFTCQLNLRYTHPTFFLLRLGDFSSQDDLILLNVCFFLQNKSNVCYAFINKVSPSQIINIVLGKVITINYNCNITA